MANRDRRAKRVVRKRLGVTFVISAPMDDGSSVDVKFKGITTGINRNGLAFRAVAPASMPTCSYREILPFLPNIKGEVTVRVGGKSVKAPCTVVRTGLSWEYPYDVFIALKFTKLPATMRRSVSLLLAAQRTAFDSVEDSAAGLPEIARDACRTMRKTYGLASCDKCRVIGCVVKRRGVAAYVGLLGTVSSLFSAGK